MEKAIEVLPVIIGMLGGLLQVVLIFAGLDAFDRLRFRVLPAERAGWFSLWGGWHLVIIIIIFTFMRESFMHDTEVFGTAAFQTEGFRVVAVWLVVPLTTSFTLSRIHDLARRHCEKKRI